MPDVTYKIVIQNRTGGGASSGTPGASAPKGSAEDMGWLADIYKGYKAITGFAPIAAAGSVAKDIFQWQVSLVGRDMGSSLMQQKIDTGMQIASQAITTAGLFIGGLATGNPLLLLGAATSAITTMIGYAKQQEQFSHDRSWENRSLVYARERAGASYNRSRVQ